MTVSIRYRFAAALAAVAALAVPAHPQTAADAAPFLHSSGTAFPAAVDGFRRTGVNEVDLKGDEISVTYETTEPKGSMYIAIRGNAGQQACRDTFRDADRDTGMRGVTRRDVPPVVLFPSTAAEQFSATYTLAASPAAAGRPQKPERVGYLWIGCTTNGLWTITYRGAFDAADDAKAAGLAKRLFGHIDWTKLTRKK